MTNKTYKSKFLAVMLGFAMCLALMLGVIFASGANTAHAEGTKQVTEVKISGLSDSDVPQIGKTATIPSITMNEGLRNTPSYFRWLCLNTYSLMSSSDTFQSGYTYAFRYDITQESDDYNVVLTEGSNMTLEGVTTNYTVQYDGRYICFIFDTLGNDGLSLIYGERLTLSDGYVGAYVTTDAMYFKGGKWPYSVDTSTIQKPAWLNRAITYDNGKAYEIYFAGTRPATAEAAQTISFQVTDANDTKKTFTGTTGATLENPNAVKNITVGYTLPNVGVTCPTSADLKSAITLPENVDLTLATFYKKDGSSHTSFSVFERWEKYYLELKLQTTGGKTFAGSSLLTASLSDDKYEYSYIFGNVTDTSLVLGISNEHHRCVDLRNNVARLKRRFIMEKKEMTPRRAARRSYEERNKDKRKQTSGNFGTMIPRDLFDEINEFLAKYHITKVQLIFRGYEALKAEYEKTDNK